MANCKPRFLGKRLLKIGSVIILCAYVCTALYWYGENTIKTEKADDIVLRILDSPLLRRPTNEPRRRYKFILEPHIQKFFEENGYKGWTSASMVKSSVDNTDRRAAIRETWGGVKKYRGNHFITIFIVARSDDEELNKNIYEEHKVHNDILMVDMKDTSENVPNKTLAGMQWVADNAPPEWIYSSADDDVALHVPNFARYIDTTRSMEQTISKCAKNITNLPIMCVYSYDKQDEPARTPSSKWYMPLSTYSEPYWPPYCRGGWYSMEVKAAKRLYEASRWIPFVRLDDVWITGLMRMKLLAKSCAPSEIFESMLHAAPLSLRNDSALQKNTGESADVVIVSHVWGNIVDRNVNVPKDLREKWHSWVGVLDGKLIL